MSTTPRPRRPAARRMALVALLLPALAGAMVDTLDARPAVCADDGDPAVRAAAERTVQLVWAQCEGDHAAVRVSDFDAKVSTFAPALANAISDDLARFATPIARVPALRALVARCRIGNPFAVSTVSTALALDRAFPAAVTSELLTDRVFAKRLTAELRAMFAKPSFAEAWDEHFQDLAEVVAWRELSAPKKPDIASPVPPQNGDPTPKAPDGVPPAGDETAGTLVPVDKSHSMTGPWTGWTQDIKERDNKRKSRSSKNIWIDRHEVTRAQYARFILAQEPSARKALLPDGWTLTDDDLPVPRPGGWDIPVTGVTFLQAMSYAESEGKRLPTEDEWERAAGGGEKEGRVFPWGDSAAGKRWAFLGTETKAPVAGGSFPDDATPEGVVDMAGNVAEFVSTQPDRRDLTSKLPDGEFYVVIRGGSYRSRESDCQSSARWRVEAHRPEEHVGFRCVMDEAEYRRRFSK